MNDVTILSPLPPSAATPVLLRGSDLADDGTAMVPRALFDRLLQQSDAGPLDVLPSDPYAHLHLIAVRFDLCDRHLPGACPVAEDGRMRLVFQLLFDDGSASDVGFHAFYNIRNDEIAAAVRTLRELAMLAPPQTGMLRVSPALTAANPEPYATKLRAFVKRYGGEARAVRLTMNAQNFRFESLVWVLRGVEKKGDAFVDITIVGATQNAEMVTLTGNPTFVVKPVADTPAGLLGAITQTTFNGADTDTKLAYLAALAAADNPLTHTAETVACVACHVSTVIMNNRAASSRNRPAGAPRPLHLAVRPLHRGRGVGAEPKHAPRARLRRQGRADLPACRQRHGADARGDRGTLSGSLTQPARRSPRPIPARARHPRAAEPVIRRSRRFAGCVGRIIQELRPQRVTVQFETGGSGGSRGVAGGVVKGSKGRRLDLVRLTGAPREMPTGIAVGIVAC